MARRSIPLSKEDCDYIRETYTYDPEQGVITFRTTVGRKAGRVTGVAQEKSGYMNLFVTLPSGRRNLKSHLVAWLLFHGVWPDHEVDHRDGDKGNNKISNLRRATPGQNRANIRKYKTYGGKPCSSQFKGVSRLKRENVWQASIRVDGELLILGKFENEIEAALAYNKAAVKHYGSYAVLNEFVKKEEEQEQVS